MKIARKSNSKGILIIEESQTEHVFDIKILLKKLPLTGFK